MALASAIALATLGCGSSSGTKSVEAPAPEPPPKVAKTTSSSTAKVKREPIQVHVAVVKARGSVMLRITGVGRGHNEGEAFEDPTKWTVTANSAGTELKRMLNGPVRLERVPVGHASGSQWNVFVRFSVAFALDGGTRDVDLTIQPPDAPTFRKRVTVAK